MTLLTSLFPLPPVSEECLLGPSFSWTPPHDLTDVFVLYQNLLPKTPKSSQRPLEVTPGDLKARQSVAKGSNVLSSGPKVSPELLKSFRNKVQDDPRMPYKKRTARIARTQLFATFLKGDFARTF